MRALRIALILACLTSVATGARAQSTADGALFLLLPVGAQTVGMAEATVAEQLGSEAIWSNPSGIARQDRKEAAIHHSETIAARGDVLTFLAPIRNLGAFGLSLNLLDFGNQQITDPGGTPVGRVLPRNILVAGTFAAAVGQRLNVGLSYKRVQYRVDCSGQCANVATFTASSNAVDFGAQYDLPTGTPLRLGAAVRNLGTRLKVNDQVQADALPTRVEAGISWQLAFIRKYVSDVSARMASDLVVDRQADDPSARFGIDVTYSQTVHLRGGYIVNDTDGANAAVGFGLGTGRLLFDIARTFGGLSEDAGKTPTYISLRFVF